MKLTFLGTRGYIQSRTLRHWRHTSTLVSYRRRRILIDYGEDWAGKAEELRPNAIVITHAHPDHAFGLRAGTVCPIYATRSAWKRMKRFPVPDDLRRLIEPRRPIIFGELCFEAFPVVHSRLAPAVGYRITAGKVVIFYVPDVVRVEDRSQSLSGVRVYVGDGATMKRPMIRRDRRSGTAIGHASIHAQLQWCKLEGVSKMIVTHCGSEIVRGDEETTEARLRRMARETGVGLEIAYDGMVRLLR